MTEARGLKGLALCLLVPFAQVIQEKNGVMWQCKLLTAQFKSAHSQTCKIFSSSYKKAASHAEQLSAIQLLKD